MNAVTRLVPYLGDGASLDEGGLVRGLGGWNEWRRRGNVGRSTGSAERDTDSIWHTLDQLIRGGVEYWWKYEEITKIKKIRQLITRQHFCLKYLHKQKRIKQLSSHTQKNK